MFSGIGKALGGQDIIIGDKPFDDAYLIKGSHPEKIKELLSDPNIKNLINKHYQATIRIKDTEGWFTTPPAGVDILELETYGVIKDINKLKDFFLLFAYILNRLTEIGCISPESTDYISK